MLHILQKCTYNIFPTHTLMLAHAEMCKELDACLLSIFLRMQSQFSGDFCIFALPKSIKIFAFCSVIYATYRPTIYVHYTAYFCAYFVFEWSEYFKDRAGTCDKCLLCYVLRLKCLYCLLC